MPNSLPPGPITADHPARPRIGRPQPADTPHDPSRASSQEACPLRDWGCAATLRAPSWRLVSSHSTSEGDVEYCRCTCGALVVLHRGELAAFTGPPADT